MASSVAAQNIQFTQGNIGSLLDNTLQIPLRAFPGRGATGLPVSLYYSSKVWRINHLNTVNNGTYLPVNEALYAEHSIAGWKTTLDIPKVEWPKETDQYYFSGKPFCFVCGSAFRRFRVARVYIHMPDGLTHELRKGDQPYEGPINMFGTFYAVDSSRLRYDSTGVDTGTLYMPDGARYVLNGGTAQFIDRNGNTLNYNASTRQWTDTLGRVLGIPLPANPLPQDYTYTLPGIGGSLTYTFRWKHLSDAGVLTPDPATGQPPARKPIANEYLPNPSQMPTGPSGGNYPQLVQSSWSERPSLFISDSDESGEGYAVIVGHNQVGGELFNPVVLTEIILPNGMSYKFTYNIYGEIDKVVYPTGGFELYKYSELPAIGDVQSPYTQANRGVTKRQLSANGTGNDIAEWLYAAADVFVGTGTALRITTTAPDKTQTEIFRNDFRAPLQPSQNPTPYWPFGFQDARNGMVFDERVYAPNPDGTRGPMVRRKVLKWEMSENLVPPRIGLPGERTEKAYRNPRPVRDVSILLDTDGDALAKTLTYFYDTTHQLSTGLDLLVSTDSHFATVDQATAQTGAIDAIPSGPLASSAETVYVSDPNYRSRNILGLMTSVILRDANGQMVSKTETFYDEAAYPLLTYSDLNGVPDYIDPGTYARGNATTVRRYVDPLANLYLETHVQYDQCGNARNVWNERGIQSQTEYSATFKRAYATLATTATPDPSGAHGSNAPFTSSSVYDYDTGLVLSITDANLQTTSFSYRNDQNTPDPLNRLRKVTRADGSWTKHEFNDVVGNLYTLTETQLDATRSTKAYQFLDALGRASRSFALETGTTYLISDTQYDQMGRVWRVSNPYRAQGLGGTIAPSEMRWTTSQYDALGRVKTVSFPDGTTMQTAFQGVYVTVTDQAGRQKRQKTDALGRIVRMDEPDAAGNLGTVDAPAQATLYDYDTQGNVIHVQQGTGSQLQHRYFKYDALSRLTYERHVEQAAIFTAADPLTNNSQWSRKITYDENNQQGLVTSMTDARNISTTYSYDNLNRIYQVAYSDGTPTVRNFYDSVRFTVQADPRTIHNLGRLAEVQTDASGILPATSQAYNYDLVGRVAQSRQNVGANPYTMLYGYNLGGGLTSETYPSGRVVNYSYDNAARLNGATSGTGTPYASSFVYGSQGALTSLTFGNGAVQTLGYNDRLQLTSLSLVKDSNTIQRYEYKYGQVNAGGTVDETKNNGQIGRIEGFIGASKQWQQRFSYDSLGRLSQASEYRGDNSQQSYLINYDYDAFGNRYQYSASNPTSTNPIPYVAVEDAHINKATNRYASGVTYDAAGNIAVDNKFRMRQYQYDANGRQKWTALPDGTGAATSVYDGTGQRVATIANGTTHYLVYDALGKLLAEYGPAPTGAGGTQYVFADHQGSTRVVTSPTGGVISRQDYQPFGEELGAVGMRSSDSSYGAANSARQKFAGMEKDDVSGMSHTLWRKYDGMSGRWTSPDPYDATMTIGDPQSFNRYAYVNNDPVNQTDPDGLYPRSQHRFITFLIASILGRADAEVISKACGDQDNIWNAATPFIFLNFNKHFGKPDDPEVMAVKVKNGELSGKELGKKLHLLQDNTPGGPHQIVEGYSWLARGLSALIHGMRDIGVALGVGSSPDKDPKRRAGFLATWIALGGKKDEYPGDLIDFILDTVNAYGLTIIGVEYIKPDGSVSSSGQVTGRRGEPLYLVDTKLVNGVRVFIWSLDPPKKKEPKKPKQKPKDKKNQEDTTQPPDNP
jgi:RHS repeat-associated protein